MNNLTSKKPAQQIKLLKILFWVFAIVLIIWALYSLFNFYMEMQKDIEISKDQSYIDKEGIEEVKLKLENR